MISAVDTNVLLDVFGADPEFGQRSAEALRACLREGVDTLTLLTECSVEALRACLWEGVSGGTCEVVWAETASFFPSPAAPRGPMERLEVGFSPLGIEAGASGQRGMAKALGQGGPPRTGGGGLPKLEPP